MSKIKRWVTYDRADFEEVEDCNVSTVYVLASDHDNTVEELMKYQREMRAHLSTVEMENSKLNKALKDAASLAVRSGATHVATLLGHTFSCSCCPNKMESGGTCSKCGWTDFDPDDVEVKK